MSGARIALVTGASRGIGRAIAIRLGRAGLVVVGTATSASGAEGIARALDEAGVAGTGLTLDVTQPQSFEPALAEIAERFGGQPSVLVNNAGITRDNLFVRMKPEDWDAVIATNLSALYHLSRSVVRSMMKARFGRIINIASVVATMGNAGQTNYAAAKAGMLGFTKSLAQEVGARGVTVNAVAPGFITTDMTEDLPEETRTRLLERIPLARLGSVDDVAHAVAFLASAEAGYITGETLHVNGGLYMA